MHLSAEEIVCLNTFLNKKEQQPKRTMKIVGSRDAENG